ncbi:MAG TPA: response regulator, partial [Segetibacter sp.]
MKPTILLVDDDKEMFEVIVVELCEKYNILTASNAKQALQILSQDVVHLIISDVMMPVMDGFEFCNIIKSILEYSSLPFILLSVKNTIQWRIKGLEMGADAYIEKPFDTKHLLAQIANLLTNRNKIKSYLAHSPLLYLKGIAPKRVEEAFLDKLNNVISANLADADLD